MPANNLNGNRPAALNAPDYEKGQRHIRALGLTADDPVIRAAAAVVDRAKTQQSVESFGWGEARVISWFLARGIEPLCATRENIRRWWNELGGYSDNTRNFHLLMLRSLYREAKKLGLMETTNNPHDDLKASTPAVLTETPALTRAEAKRFIRSIDASKLDPDGRLDALRDGVMVGLMLRMCLRASEVQSLRWDCLSVDRGTTRLSFIGKGRKPAKMNVPAGLVRRLAAWRAALEEAVGQPMSGSDPIILATAGHQFRVAHLRRRGQPLKAMDPSTMFDVVRDRLAAIKITGARMGPHALRATGATLAYENGKNLVACQMLLRHASIETTRKYYIKRLDDSGAEAMMLMDLEDEDEDAA